MKGGLDETRQYKERLEGRCPAGEGRGDKEEPGAACSCRAPP